MQYYRILAVVVILGVVAFSSNFSLEFRDPDDPNVPIENPAFSFGCQSNNTAPQATADLEPPSNVANSGPLPRVEKPAPVRTGPTSPGIFLGSPEPSHSNGSSRLKSNPFYKQ
ncbi:MAG: hypothetical protein AAFN77_05515 [Planctomycetota bacterium]